MHKVLNELQFSGLLWFLLLNRYIFFTITYATRNLCFPRLKILAAFFPRYGKWAQAGHWLQNWLLHPSKFKESSLLEKKKSLTPLFKNQIRFMPPFFKNQKMSFSHAARPNWMEGGIFWRRAKQARWASASCSSEASKIQLGVFKFVNFKP